MRRYAGLRGIWALVPIRRTDPEPWGMRTQTPTRDGTVLLTPADAARVANVSRDTIYREIERGALPVRHVGRQLRIDPLDFRHYLERGPVA
jgi:excisionase family DNA binding protein